MDIGTLKTGDRLILEDGSLADVVTPSTDGGRSVRIRYVECPFDAKLIGTEAVRDDYDILAFVAGPELNSDAAQTIGGQPAPGALGRPNPSRPQ